MRSSNLIYFLSIMFFQIVHVSKANAKIVVSEFLNQAEVGSEGPQLAEVDLAGAKAYLLSYNSNKPGKAAKFKNISEKEYLTLKSQMQKFLKDAIDDEDATKTPGCDRQLTYTKVEKESQVTNKTLCWANLGAQKRIELSDWIISVRKKLQ